MSNPTGLARRELYIDTRDLQSDSAPDKPMTAEEYAAVLEEETGKYDREYNSEHFTTYFDKIVGTGVCIHNDPDSFSVRFEGGTAEVQAQVDKITPPPIGSVKFSAAQDVGPE